MITGMVSVAGSLTEYGMPRFDKLPSFTCEIAKIHSPTNPFGMKPGGEGGTTSAPSGVPSR
jgi:aerobic carbon-monoxide dehydrogenase large subunit